MSTIESIQWLESESVIAEKQAAAIAEIGRDGTEFAERALRAQRASVHTRATAALASRQYAIAH